jgi:hypothetical protein
MRVQFEFTLDDVVDVQLRVLKRSRAARAWRLRDLVATALLSGVLLFAIIPGETSTRLIVGILGLILGAVFYPIVNESTVKRRLMKLLQENAGPDSVSICEVELSDSGVHARQNGMEIIYRWENVKEVKETRDSVDIYAEKGGLVVVRKRAFNGSAEQEQHFIELATQYVNKAHAGTQLNRAG